MKGLGLSFTIIAGLVVMAVAGSEVIRAAELSLSRRTVDGGGIMRSTGDELELSSSIGQPDAGSLSGRDLGLVGGFWFPLATGDCNADGCVDVADYGALTRCLSGPRGGVPTGCACFDLDRDSDVDLIDAADFQVSFTGG
jgi:hypothetical protein